MIRILSDAELDAATGGLSFETHIRAFTEANSRWTDIRNKGGPAATQSPKALKYERLMKMIDAYPYPYKRGVSY
jgi:hypothetical protein